MTRKSNQLGELLKETRRMVSNSRKMRRDAAEAVSVAAAGLRKARKRKPRLPREDLNRAAFQAIQETTRISKS
jgi:hypothetical protein